MGLDNGGGLEHRYGAERNGRTSGCGLQQWYIEGLRCGDGSECGSVDVKQSSRGWTGSGVGAKGHDNREVEGEEG